MDASEGSGKAKAKRQWKKIDAGQILDIQSYEEQRKGQEVKGKGKEKGKGNGKEKGKENGEGKGKGKGKREEDLSVESPESERPTSYPPRVSPKGGRRERDGKGKGRRKGFPGPQGGFQADESQPAPEEARPPPAQVAPGTMAGSPPFHGAVGKGAYMAPAPMAQVPFEMPMQMFPPCMGGMAMPYMGGFAPEMMPCMSASPQRNDLVTKAKAQIEYYFSTGNLVKDVHLRKNVMDTQGWVSFSGLIQFPKLAQLTGDPTIILDAIHGLPQLEMKPDNSAVRLKDNWQKWVWQQGD